ncbi:MAG: hypothetical protein ACI9Y1_003231 [Lentisphaeria bacterium]
MSVMAVMAVVMSDGALLIRPTLIRPTIIGPTLCGLLAMGKCWFLIGRHIYEMYTRYQSRKNLYLFSGI